MNPPHRMNECNVCFANDFDRLKQAIRLLSTIFQSNNEFSTIFVKCVMPLARGQKTMLSLFIFEVDQCIIVQY